MPVNNTLSIIRQRRTVKPVLFNDQIITEDVLMEILEAANWAPNHGRTEPWRLTVFSGEGLGKYRALITKVWDETPEDMKKPGKLEKWTSNAARASHIIALGMKRTDCPIPYIEEVCAVSCAAQNMMLVASEHGVGSYWSSGVMHFPTAAKAFGLDGEVDCMLGFLHLGYSDEPFAEGCRKSPIDTKITWVN